MYEIVILQLLLGLLWAWVGFGLVWFGLVWFGLVWFGLVWFGLGWLAFFISDFITITCRDRQTIRLSAGIVRVHRQRNTLGT